MTIGRQDIISVIKQQIESFETTAVMANVGSVVEIGDGVARIHGLSQARNGELLEFPHGIMGIVLNLEEDSV
ncbi:MAG: F0F1 ATP synthase subunit alpha, partial [Dehalococcoidia bacterium]|nr:F0F1 ATP synthase subunit alpha [Dehalococcoidia bacterium]